LIKTHYAAERLWFSAEQPHGLKWCVGGGTNAAVVLPSVEAGRGAGYLYRLTQSIPVPVGEHLSILVSVSTEIA